jgi:hypothetical protein
MQILICVERLGLTNIQVLFLFIYFATTLHYSIFHRRHHGAYKTNVKAGRPILYEFLPQNCEVLHQLMFSLFGGEEIRTRLNSVSLLQHTGSTFYSSTGVYSTLHTMPTHRPREVDIRTTLRDAIFGLGGDKEQRGSRRSVLGAGLSLRRYSLKIV